MDAIKQIKGNSVYRIMPVIFKQIVFAKKELVDASGVSVNVVSKIVDQLVKMGILYLTRKVSQPATWPAAEPKGTTISIFQIAPWIYE